MQARDYVEKVDGRSFRPTQLGKMVVDGLVGTHLDFMEPSFTAKMEEDLDEVEAGRMERVELLSRFYARFREVLATERPGETDLGRVRRAFAAIAQDYAGRRGELAQFQHLVDSEPAHLAASRRLVAPQEMTDPEYALSVKVVNTPEALDTTAVNDPDAQTAASSSTTTTTSWGGASPMRWKSTSRAICSIPLQRCGCPCASRRERATPPPPSGLVRATFGARQQIHAFKCTFPCLPTRAEWVSNATFHENCSHR